MHCANAQNWRRWQIPCPFLVPWRRCVHSSRTSLGVDDPLGWAFGDVHGDDYTLRRLAVDYRLAVINYEYRLAPEHPFPTAPDDCFKAFKYFAANPDLLSADFSKGLIVGGSSAGANLAAVLVHLVRDDPHLKDTPITGQLLVIPALVHPKAYPEKFKSSLLSMEQNKDAPILPKAMIETFYNWYKAVPTDPKTSPLLYPSHEGLPPAYFQICGLDPLRDEGLLYEKILKQVGVRTKLEVYPGVPHGFLSVARDITLGKKYLNDFRLGVEWLLREGLSKQSFLAARG
ncbi:hypothetical protein E1B28_006338 [Marasmius oreades]|uniref:Alpha/beta hydrolase fold-3 domain-containing protein n=1 Tax=Marasmius oreades TaxID=181124 RepID=A0A9P7UVH3_9AGAR|nr:uncharacterized protein E1B28_006338 [Marasmius oreades]KAG7095613.1 hypothetical protein E1B28_006338 [Marasmius oreades]